MKNLGKRWLATRIGASALAATMMMSFGTVLLEQEAKLRADTTINGDVEINEQNFPDETFRTYIKPYDKNKDGVLSQAELDAVKGISLYKSNVTTLSGIEYFTEITKLTCSDNQITTLDLSKNTKLEYAYVGFNPLTSLNVSGCTELTYLSCRASKLTSVDVSKNTKLESLYVDSNALTTLDVSKCPDLKLLWCHSNKLTSINIASNPLLETLYISNNDISTVDLSTCPNLINLHADSTKLSSLNISKNTKLEELNIDYTAIASLTLSGCPDFKKLYAQDTKLTSIDVSQNPLLDTLTLNSCSGISTIDVKNNPLLYSLGVGGTQITSLDLSKNPELHSLHVDGCSKLTALDVSNSPKLAYLYARWTPITTLNLENNPLLQVCWLDSTKLSALDVSHNPALNHFSISNTGISAIDVTNNPNLQYFYIANTDISSLNLTNCRDIRYLEANGTKLTTLEIGMCMHLIDAVTNCPNPESYGSDDKSYRYKSGNYTLICPKVVTFTINRPDGIEICEYYFPDEVFRNYVKQFDVNGNGFLTDSERAAVTEIVLQNQEVKSLVGVEHFPELQTLLCDTNKIESLDISANAKLLTLSCSNNKLSSLDLSGNAQLVSLNVESNQFDSIDLSGLANLADLNIGHNKLKSIDVTHNTGLLKLNICWNTSLKSIDLSQNTKLISLRVTGLNIWTIDISNSPCLVKAYQEGVKTQVGSTFEYAYDAGAVTYFLAIDSDMYMITPDPVNPDPVNPDPVNPDPVNPDPVNPDPQPVKEPSFEDFVERLYVVALGRPSEAEGKAYWVEQVVKNGFTGADCARFFMLGAPEFLGRNLTDDEFVEVLYKTYFDRDSEPDGKAYWMGRLASGTERAVLVEEFIESVEWCNICAMYGVKSGAKYHKATVPSKNAVKFATRLYTCCLGRDPEAEGLEYWALALTNLDVSGYQAASCFFTLPEFVGLKTTNEEYLTRLYTTFMGREPEADGFAYWLGLLNGGTDRVDVMKAFAGCPEFQEICNQYGIVRGEI